MGMLQLLEGGKSSDNVVLPSRALQFERSKQLVRQQIMNDILAKPDVPSWQNAVRGAWPELKSIGRKSALKASTIEDWLTEHPLPNTPENSLLSTREIRMPFDRNEARQYEAVMREEWDWLMDDLLSLLRWRTNDYLDQARSILEMRGKRINNITLLEPVELKKYCRAAVKEVLAAAVGNVAHRYKRFGGSYKIYDHEATIAAHHCGPLLANAEPTGIVLGKVEINFGAPIEDDDFAVFVKVMENYYRMYGKWLAPISILYKRAIERGLLPPPIRSYETRIRELETLIAASRK